MLTGYVKMFILCICLVTNILGTKYCSSGHIHPPIPARRCWLGLGLRGPFAFGQQFPFRPCDRESLRGDCKARAGKRKTSSFLLAPQSSQPGLPSLAAAVGSCPSHTPRMVHSPQRNQHQRGDRSLQRSGSQVRRILP